MSASNVAEGDEVTVCLPWNEFMQRRVLDAAPHSFEVSVGPLPSSRHRFWLIEEGRSWARGWNTEDARALEATVLLTASAR